MAELTRRDFLRRSAAGLGLGAAAGGILDGCAASAKGDLARKSGRRVVVIGGGWGGATAAKYVRLQDPSIEVILLEPNRSFVSCPFSNLVLSGLETMSAITFPYDGLRAHGVKIRHETATAVEPDTKRVRIGEGYLEYDRLVVSPGVDFVWDQVEGVAGQESAILHAWKAGPQTAELASRLQGLPDGGVVVMTVPPVAYRCPPGPYERACQIAWFLQTKKPRAKLVVLDANNDIVSKTGLFKAVFRNYPNLEYRPTSKIERVDLAGREILPAIGDRVRYDVLNLIPPQRAGAIALQAGLGDANNRWCEVNHVTYESTKQPGRARDRRRHHRLAGAQVRQHRQRDGQDLRDRDRPSAERQGASGPGARQHLLQLDQRSRGHRGRQRVPDRQRQGRPDRAEADPAPGGVGGAELDRVADEHLERCPGLSGGERCGH